MKVVLPLVLTSALDRAGKLEEAPYRRGIGGGGGVHFGIRGEWREHGSSVN